MVHDRLDKFVSKTTLNLLHKSAGKDVDCVLHMTSHLQELSNAELSTESLFGVIDFIVPIGYFAIKGFCLFIFFRQH
jgi:hypothetical protein